jgi:hypothetical protein
MTLTHDMIMAVERLSAYLRADLKRFANDDAYDATRFDVWVPDVPGKNVVRIVHKDGSHRSAYCFVVLTDITKDGREFKAGDILKADGWKAPTWNKARGNVLTNEYKACTWAGPGYLR